MHFTFFESYYKSAKYLPDDERLKLYDHICEFMFTDTDEPLEGIAGAVWEAIKPVVQKSKRKAEAGRAGGVSKSKTEANEKQNVSKEEATANKPQANRKQTASHKDKDKEKEKEKDIYPPKPPLSEPEKQNESKQKDDPNDKKPDKPSSEDVRKVVDHLNAVCGTHYRYDTEATAKHIRARLSEGFTVGDCMRVIDIKHRQWANDPKMAGFLRPQTLFSGNFEGYLNQKEVIQTDARGQPPAGWGEHDDPYAKWRDNWSSGEDNPP